MLPTLKCVKHRRLRNDFNSQLPITNYPLPICDTLEGLSKLTHPVFSGVS